MARQGQGIRLVKMNTPDKIFSSVEILLASKSPRRSQLMQMAAIPFKLAKIKDVDEVYPATITADEVPAYLSQIKAAAYKTELNDKQVVITADTVVILGDMILGKPHDANHAIDMLSMLSGNVHRVVTGVTVMSADKNITFSVESEVEFGKLTSEQIRYYVETYKPFDKAGAYGIQEWIGAIGIKGINGSYYNVMGLPIHRLYHELCRFVQSN